VKNNEIVVTSARSDQNLWKSGSIQKYCAIVGYTCHFPDLPISASNAWKI